MRNVIFIDQIAQGGEQGWSQPHIPQSERKPFSRGQKLAVLLTLNAWLWLVIWAAVRHIKP